MAPDVASAEPLRPHVVRVTFADGEVRDVDIGPLLGGEAFRALTDPEAFGRVFVDAETRTVAWPNGADLDPDVIYEAVTGAAPVTVRARRRA